MSSHKKKSNNKKMGKKRHKIGMKLKKMGDNSAKNQKGKEKKHLPAPSAAKKQNLSQVAGRESDQQLKKWSVGSEFLN